MSPANQIIVMQRAIKHWIVVRTGERAAAAAAYEEEELLRAIDADEEHGLMNL
jgi:hypothetical protein